MKRNILAIVLSSVLFVACSSAEAEEVQENNEAQVTTEQTEQAEDTAYTYVDVADREVVLEDTPEKVVVSYMPLWESTIALGVPAVGAPGVENYLATWDSFEGYDVGTPTDIGLQEFNLETVVSIDPDIILYQISDKNSYDVDNIEKIAPTALFENEARINWRANLEEVGASLNRSKEAETLISDTEDYIKDSREELDEVMGDKTVLHLSIMGDGIYAAQYREHLYDDEHGLGLNTPEGFSFGDNGQSSEVLSIEGIAELNPDYLFIAVFDGDEKFYDNLAGNSVFQSLDAYKNDKIYITDGSSHSNGPLSVIYTVNFVIDALLNDLG